jgi:hypothetical protein
MSLIKNIWFFLWGLPQNIIGFVMMMYFKGAGFRVQKYNDAFLIVMRNQNIGAVSLGQFIFIFSNYQEREQFVIRHEYGHTKQSHLLGPLYLLVIGVPSFIWARYFKDYRKKYNVDYYSFWPERWANKLGGNS